MGEEEEDAGEGEEGEGEEGKEEGGRVSASFSGTRVEEGEDGAGAGVSGWVVGICLRARTRSCMCST